MEALNLSEDELLKRTEMNWINVEVLLPEIYDQPHNRFFDHFTKMFKDSKTKEEFFVQKPFASDKSQIKGDNFHKLAMKYKNRCKGCKVE